LSAYTLEAQGTLVIAANAGVFEAMYGFAPDLVGGANSAANSNGDDNFVLLGPFGTLIDIFGVIGKRVCEPPYTRPAWFTLSAVEGYGGVRGAVATFKSSPVYSIKIIHF
jgi:hypothetical protein